MPILGRLFYSGEDAASLALIGILSVISQIYHSYGDMYAVTVWKP